MSVTESPSICEDATSSLRAGPGSAISPPSPGGTSCFAPFSTSVGLVAAVAGHDQPRVRGQGAPPRGLARLLLRRRVHAGQASSLGLFALRLAVGIGAIHHGPDKLVDPAGFVANGVVPQAITAGTSFGRRDGAALDGALVEGVDALLHTSSGFDQVVLHIEDPQQLLV